VAWWAGVEKRESLDPRAAALLRNQLSRMQWLIDELRHQQYPNTTLIRDYCDCHKTLSARHEGYVAKLQ
jgi:hypothetical protein